jgi:hypothetical protein
MKLIRFLIFAAILFKGNFLAQLETYAIPESEYLLNKSVANITPYIYYVDSVNIRTPLDSALLVGETENVNIDIINNGNLITSQNGIKIYRIVIEVTNAKEIGVTFNDFFIPDSCKLFMYDESRSKIYGAFTKINNQADSIFSINSINASKIVLEFNQPNSNLQLPRLKINRVYKINKNTFESSSFNNQQSSCFEDVHCRSNLNVERSVIKWRYRDTKDDKIYLCSCAIINQDVSSNDVKPLLITANHCGKNADLSTATFIFNFQNSNCNVFNSTNNFSMNGASKKASRAVCDMFLMELNSFPPPDFNVHLAGWDRSNRDALSDNVMGIHHPGGIVKKISLGTFKANTNTNFWRVEWDRNNSPTEGGSSGSPLFEEDNDRIVGFLSYGASACDDLNGVDRYGKFNNAWNAVFGSDSRLRDWLDSSNNDPLEIDGRDPCFNNLQINSRNFFSAQQLYQPENKVTVQAGNKIETTGNTRIFSNSEYVFKAGLDIEFKNEFIVDNGAEFVAKIEPCQNIVNRISHNNISQPEIESDENMKSNNVFTDNIVEINPNPTSKYSILKYKLKSYVKLDLKLLNAQGQTLYEKQIQNDKNSTIEDSVILDLSNLNSGLFFCVCKFDNFVITKKIIKE